MITIYENVLFTDLSGEKIEKTPVTKMLPMLELVALEWNLCLSRAVDFKT